MNRKKSLRDWKREPIYQSRPEKDKNLEKIFGGWFSTLGDFKTMVRGFIAIVGIYLVIPSVTGDNMGLKIH